jgi:YihY family inner membrane protein
VNKGELAVRRIDAFQQRHLVTAFTVGLLKKYGDDNGGALSARLTFAIFTTIFPLLLLLVTGLALVLANNPELRRTVEQSAFSQIPVVGADLADNIHAIKASSAFGFTIGILGLIYGLNGLAGVGLQIMEQAWYLPKATWPPYLTRLKRSYGFIAVLGLGLVVTTFLSTFGAVGGHRVVFRVGSVVVAGVVNAALYLLGFRVLTPKQVPTRRLWPGAICGGLLWTVLQAFGTFIVNRYLRHANVVYGTFGTVIGMIAWFTLAAQLTVYCAELNALLVHRLWPRGMVQPPLTRADQEMVALQATMNQFRPEAEITVRVRGRPMTEREYLAAGGAVGSDEIGIVRQVPEPGEQAPAAPGGARGARDGAA